MFDQIVKYLDLRRATKDETLVTKPLSLHKARAIKKVQDYITLSPLFAFIAPPIGSSPTLLFQYNISVGFDFTFDWPDKGFVANGGMLMVKWRNDNVVQRYALHSPAQAFEGFGVSATKLQQFYNAYTNQIIPSNCVFEFWGFLQFGNIGVLPPGFTIRLSRLRNPVDAEDVGVVSQTVLPYVAERFYNNFVDPIGPQVAGVFGTDLPETLPYAQDIEAWLTN